MSDRIVALADVLTLTMATGSPITNLGGRDGPSDSAFSTCAYGSADNCNVVGPVTVTTTTTNEVTAATHVGAKRKAGQQDRRGLDDDHHHNTPMEEDDDDDDEECEYEYSDDDKCEDEEGTLAPEEGIDAANLSPVDGTATTTSTSSTVAGGTGPGSPGGNNNKAGGNSDGTSLGVDNYNHNNNTGDGNDDRDDELETLRATVRDLQEEVRRKDGQLEHKARQVREGNQQLCFYEVQLHAWSVVMSHYDDQVRDIPDLRRRLSEAEEERDNFRRQLDEERRGRGRGRLPRARDGNPGGDVDDDEEDMEDVAALMRREIRERIRMRHEEPQPRWDVPVPPVPPVPPFPWEALLRRHDDEEEAPGVRPALDDRVIDLVFDRDDEEDQGPNGIDPV